MGGSSNGHVAVHGQGWSSEFDSGVYLLQQLDPHHEDLWVADVVQRHPPPYYNAEPCRKRYVSKTFNTGSIHTPSLVDKHFINRLQNFEYRVDSDPYVCFYDGVKKKSGPAKK